MTEAAPSPAIDQATFDTRFAMVRDRLLHLCIGLVGADEAEDVVHDTYLRTRDRHAQLRDPELFEAWACKTAANLCFNRHRERSRWLASLRRIARRPEAAPGRDLGLRELIERLPSRERTVVVLHYGNGYRIEEIARLLDLSAVNARTILFRARRRLAAQLREDLR